MKERLQINSELRQQQTLTPMQVQYVRLLEMNAAAIEDEVQRRLDENPALEVAGDADTSGSAADDSFNESAEDLQRADYRDEDDMPAMPADRSRRHDDSGNSVSTILEGTAAVEESLSDSLMRQFGEAGYDEATTRLARYIIGNLDNNGRLTRTLADIADDITVATGDEVGRSDLLPAYDAVRSLDPPGVCAADLRDCLLLQLRRRDDGSDVYRVAIDIVSHYFDLLGTRRTDKIASRLRTDSSILESALHLIRSLDPYPGSSAQSTADRALHITPDLTVEPDYEDGSGTRFLVSLAQNIPELAVADWVNIPTETAGGAHSEAAAFGRALGREARDFIELLKRRNDTLLDVMKAIVELQPEFFRTEDSSAIRPMILKEVAAHTGRDISVVSRATAGKYVAMPGGTYPLKMFFNEAPTSDADVSTHNILKAIGDLIENEDKSAPLSDDAITALLRDEGLEIARRTVAKYREQLGIANSRARTERRISPRPKQ